MRYVGWHEHGNTRLCRELWGRMVKYTLWFAIFMIVWTIGSALGI